MCQLLAPKATGAPGQLVDTSTLLPRGQTRGGQPEGRQQPQGATGVPPWFQGRFKVVSRSFQGSFKIISGFLLRPSALCSASERAGRLIRPALPWRRWPEHPALN